MGRIQSPASRPVGIAASRVNLDRTRDHLGDLILIRVLPLAVVAGLAAFLATLATVAVPTVGAADDAQLARGTAIYGERCAVCHGTNLEGGLGPSLIADDLATRHPTALDLFTYVRDNMPFNDPGSLTDAQYLDAVALILDRRGVMFEGGLTTANAASIALGSGTPVETPTVAPPPVPAPTPGPPPAAPASGNRPPAKPMVWDPVPTHQSNVVSPYFLNFQTNPFVDPDVGDTHGATQFEIWSFQLNSRVWSTTVTHPADQASLLNGTFEGPLAGHLGLQHDHAYAVRARHQDDSGDAGSEWSSWSDWRHVRTASPGRFVGPMRVRDIQPSTLTWVADDGSPVLLAPGNSVLLTGSRSHLHRIEGTEAGNRVRDFAPAQRYVNLFFHFRSDGAELVVPPSRVSFLDATGVRRTIWLPYMRLDQGRHLNAAASAQGDFFFEGYIRLNEREAEPSLFTLVRIVQDPWRVRQGYDLELVATGLTLPMQIAVVPSTVAVPGGPVLYVTELGGSVKAVGSDGTVWTYASGILDQGPGEPPTDFAGEIGTSGIAVHPSTGDVYVATVSSGPDGYYNKIVHFESADGGRTAARQRDLLAMTDEITRPSHQIHGLLFGNDGMLYAAVGDGFEAGRGLDDSRFGGKIIRLNADGSAPPDNPKYDPDDPDGAISYQWAKGFRNIFGLAQRPDDDALYTAENGLTIDRIARVERGDDFGWTGVPASALDKGIWYLGPPAEAPTGVAIVTGGILASNLQDHLLVGAFGPQPFGVGTTARGKVIWDFPLLGDGSVRSRPTMLVKYIGSGMARVVGVAYAPDGLLFTEFFADGAIDNPFEAGARIWRVVPKARSVP